jgi:non-ribosomal peptide synthase protein (TIGR01720 family)
VSWGYSERFHRAPRIEALARAFGEELRTLVEHSRSHTAPRYTPSDFPDAELTQAELDRALAEIGARPAPSQHA